MATVLVVHTSDGVRRCDGKCHNAKHAKCTCICGGANHGVGLEQAAQQAKELAEQMQQGGVVEVVVPLVAEQLPLPGCGR